MPSMSAQALRMAVINAATIDASFRAALVTEGAKAVTDKFGEQPMTIAVEFEAAGQLPFLIPEKTEKLAHSIARVVEELGDRSPTRGEFEAVIIQRAWNEPAFLAQLRSDPQKAIDKGLREYGASVPEGVQVKLYEEKTGQCVIVIPRPLDAGAELTDAELEAVAGGEGIAVAVVGAVAGAVAGAIATKIVDKIWADETQQKEFEP